MVHQRQHRALVRDRHPHAADVVGQQAVLHEAGQMGCPDLRGHHHRIHAMTPEQVVVDLGRTNLGHGVADDQKDACRAGDVHAGLSLIEFIVSGRQ